MKHSWQDILKFLRTLLMVFAVVLSLCACSTNEDEVSGAKLSGEQSELDEQQRSCWQAGLLEMFYEAMAASSMKAYPKVTTSAMAFIMVAFAIWLSIRLLKHVSSLVEESPAEVWTEVSKMAFMCLFCGLLASSTDFLLFTLNTFIFPIYYAFLEYGSLVLESVAGDEAIDIPGQAIGIEGDAVDKTCLYYTNDLICTAPPLDKVSLSGATATFPSGPSYMMQCLVCALSDRFQVGFTIAKNLLGMTNLTAVIVGLLLYAIFTMVKVSFVFYLVDSIFRMNIVVIILPFLILAIPFKFSRGWAKEGLLTILNSSAAMMCIAICLTLAMVAMQLLISENARGIGRVDMYADFGIVPLGMLLISFVVLKSSGIAVALAGAIVGGGGNTNFQKKVGKLAAFAAKKVFIFCTGAIGKIFTQGLDKLKELKDSKDDAKK